jgi:two-component system, NtrC family, response regulator AlgB
MHDTRRAKCETAMKVLLVEDDAPLRRTLRVTLEASGHTVSEAAGGEAAVGLLARTPHDLALVDVKLGRASGIALMAELKKAQPGLVVVLMTAYATVETAVEALRGGAYDFLTKPFTPKQLAVALDRVAEVLALRAEVAGLKAELAAVNPEQVPTADPAFARLLDQVRKAAKADATILLRGESGVGKGVMAKRVHAESNRAKGPFVTVSCPSLSAELLESELFGHTQGAFTGAVKETFGKVAAADRGTLFLDEIGDLPPPLQPKLLRFLQEREYERVGETRTRTADVRVIAATNRDLKADVTAGRFREDLLFRLEVIEFTLPPLRDRKPDILPLARAALAGFARQMGKKLTGFDPAAEALLTAYRWPGNLRELRNACERVALLCDGPKVTPDDLPERLRHRSPPSPGVNTTAPLRTLEEVEAEHIARVLAATPSLDEAAEVLGIDPSTLYRKRKKLGI